MKPQVETDWNVTQQSAQELQTRLACGVRLVPLAGISERLCAVAAAERAGTATAVALADEEPVVIQRPAPRPYMSGLFIFAVGPAIEAALEDIELRPDALLCLGHGIAHPRRCGLATHLGVLYDIPTIGVADQPLVGKYEQPPEERGAWRPLVLEGETVGAAVRTRRGTRPLIVSPGNLVTLDDCRKVILAWTEKYRWPEPLRRVRQACRLAGDAATRVVRGQ